MERQDKFRLSDAAPRARVDSFNRSRANLGMQNTMKAIRTGVAVAGAGATGGGSLLLDAYIRGQENKNKSYYDTDLRYNDPYRTNIDDTQYDPNDFSKIS